MLTDKDARPVFFQLIKEDLALTTSVVLFGISLSGCDYWPPALHLEIEELQSHLNDALDERQQLDNDNAELRDKQVSLQQEIDQKRRENETLRDRLAEMANRTSQSAVPRRIAAPSTEPSREPQMKGPYTRLQPVHPPMSGPKVARLQRLLQQQGFPIRIDGIYGPDTVAAVRGFQRYHGLSADGSVGPETDRLLRRSASAPQLVRELRLQHPPLEGRDVTLVQRALRRAGQRVAIDGRFGAETDVAVTRFQQKHGLEPDGIVGPNTWTRLKTRR